MNCQTLLLVFWHRKSLQQRNYRYILNVRFFLLIDSIVKCRLFYDYFIASSTGCGNTVYVGISVFPLKYEPAQVMNINLYITINHVAITLNLLVAKRSICRAFRPARLPKALTPLTSTQRRVERALRFTHRAR